MKADIDMKEPRYEEIVSDLRVLEGLLAFYGLERIDFESASAEWLPESEEESARLMVRSFNIGFQPIEIRGVEPIPFEIIARSVLAASRAHSLEMPLSFYRKGLRDITDRRFIEAFYEFYFMIETLFSQGQARSAAVKRRFKESPPLCAAIAKALTVEQRQPRPQALEGAFAQKYRGRSVDEIIDRFVTLRGFLHHHSSKRPGVWHPEGHSEYEIDALVIGRVALELAFALAAPYVLAKDISVSFQKGPPPL